MSDVKVWCWTGAPLSDVGIQYVITIPGIRILVQKNGLVRSREWENPWEPGSPEHWKLLE